MAKRSVRDMLKARAWNKQVSLADVDPGDHLGVKRKNVVAAREKYGPELLDLQERLFAEKKQAILIVLQGLDTSGKDGTVRHVMAAMNPQGVHVRPFMAPNATELRHHFLWRFKKELPGPGHITIFNRSYYEDVLIARVKKLAAADVIESRYAQINRFEAGLVRSNVIPVKICLHISNEEQRQRLLARLNTPEKRWKFSLNDIKERSHWDEYQEAFNMLLTRCSTPVAPWYIVPADDKPFRDWAVSRILLETLRAMNPRVPMPKLNVASLVRQLPPVD
jgi:PPK2 family polyphosphate:nucleotide phosphotransferase